MEKVSFYDSMAEKNGLHQTGMEGDQEPAGNGPIDLASQVLLAPLVNALASENPALLVGLGQAIESEINRRMGLKADAKKIHQAYIPLPVNSGVAGLDLATANYGFLDPIAQALAPVRLWTLDGVAAHIEDQVDSRLAAAKDAAKNPVVQPVAGGEVSAKGLYPTMPKQ